MFYVLWFLILGLLSVVVVIVAVIDLSSSNTTVVLQSGHVSIYQRGGGVNIIQNIICLRLCAFNIKIKLGSLFSFLLPPSLLIIAKTTCGLFYSQKEVMPGKVSELPG